MLYHLKGLCEGFPLMWLNIGIPRKITKMKFFPHLIFSSKTKQAFHFTVYFLREINFNVCELNPWHFGVKTSHPNYCIFRPAVPIRV